MFLSNLKRQNHFFIPYYDQQHPLSLFNKQIITRNMNIDMVDKENFYQIKAVLPGRNKDDIKIKLKNDVLTISSEEFSKKKSEEDNYIYSEIFEGSISRSVTIPENIDETNIKATYLDGILEINIPKNEKSSKEIIIE